MSTRLSIESNRRELQESLTIAVRPGRSAILGSSSLGVWFSGAGLSLLLFLGRTTEAWSAVGSIPGEDRVGWFYAVTHLHPAAYLLLFFVFLLALANLLFQYGTGMFRKPLSLILSIIRNREHETLARPVLMGLKRSGLHEPPEKKRRKPLLPAQSRVQGSEAVGPVRQGIGPPPAAKPLTPLDGVNHSLPDFPAPVAGNAGAPRVGQGKLETKVHTEFKFSSAVDVPSREEIERREKEQLVVSGVVHGPDRKGMSSVIVYLTDSDGRRVGQSCRSAADTGEFRVLINEPGQYSLKGYKRGFVMESAEPLLLPIESGKIEGYNFRMIPEGSLISGRLLPAGATEALADYQIRCTCKTPEYVQTCHTDSAGLFRIQGAPTNSECYLEVLTGDGTLLMRSAPFRTGRKKEHYVEVRLPETGTIEDASRGEKLAESSVGDHEEDAGSSGPPEPTGSQQPSSSF